MADVKLSTDTLNVLKKMYEINQSLKIDPTQTETIDDKETTIVRSRTENKTMMARVNISEVLPREVHIYDLREFNSAIGIVNDPVFNFDNDKYILIKSSDGKQKLKYHECDPRLFDNNVTKDIPIDNVDIEVTVTEQQFKSVLSAAHTMKLDYVGFIADGETLNLVAFSMNDGSNKETNSFKVELCDCEEEFRLFYRLSAHNISVLVGEGDLKIEIDGNKGGKRKVSKFSTQSGKTIWAAFDSKSEY